MSERRAGRRSIPVVEGGCDMCPNDMVEVFWEGSSRAGRSRRTFCPSCGNSTRTDYPAKKRKSHTRRSKPAPRLMHDEEARRQEWERVQWIKEQQERQRTRGRKP